MNISVEYVLNQYKWFIAVYLLKVICIQRTVLGVPCGINKKNELEKVLTFKASIEKILILKLSGFFSPFFRVLSC